MIPLFHIKDWHVHTGRFSNLLQDKVVGDLEQSIANFVGAKYAVTFNSATSAIFLALKYVRKFAKPIVELPSILPPVVVNAAIHAGYQIRFTDNVSWVGGSYTLWDDGIKIIDSAHRLDYNQFHEAGDDDLMVFSFYPTKPVGSCDGGMIVSNNLDAITWLRAAANNGMTQSTNSWERKVSMAGWKMYMNSIQAYLALQNFKCYFEKQARLSEIRYIYNDQLGYQNQSDHLYRIEVADNGWFIKYMGEHGVQCGKHYEALHTHPFYATHQYLPESEYVSATTVSLPLHEALTDDQVYMICDLVKGAIK